MNKIEKIDLNLRAKISEMEELSKNEQMTDEQVNRWNALKSEVTKLQDELRIAKEQEELNKLLLRESLRNEDDGEKKDVVKSFHRALNEYVQTSGRSISKEFLGNEGGLVIPKEILYRADPILTTTNSALVNVNSQPMALVTGDDFSLLRSLGVQFLEGLNGKQELPYMAQIVASQPNENLDVSTANATPLNVEIAPRAFGAFQTFSKQALLSMAPSIYNTIIQDMQLSVERKVVSDLFNKFFTVSDVSIAPTASGLTYGDMINLTNVDYNIGNAAFVTDNLIRVYLEQKPVNSTGIALAWNSINNTIGGRTAVSSQAMKARRAVYGNFSFAAVGIWGSPELIVNPYTYDSTGKLKVTVLGFYDTGIRNKYAFKFFNTDASCSL